MENTFSRWFFSKKRTKVNVFFFFSPSRLIVWSLWQTQFSSSQFCHFELTLLPLFCFTRREPTERQTQLPAVRSPAEQADAAHQEQAQVCREGGYGEVEESEPGRVLEPTQERHPTVQPRADEEPEPAVPTRAED